MGPGLRERLLAPLALLAAVFLFYWAREEAQHAGSTRQGPRSELVQAVRDNRVESAEFRNEQIVAKLRPQEGKPAETLIVNRLPNVDEDSLVQEMDQHHVVVSGKAEPTSIWGPLLWSLLPFFLLPALFWMLSGGLLRKGGKPLSIGKSKAKVYDRSAENRVTFKDVAGVDEAKAELMEVVSFLKEPATYRAIGARIPKGVLLVGPPGTGKTLLAKAIAGESGVPFFSMSGSEFVEMFVGVGASRVRDLFEQAKERAPCIIFVDELDAIGKSRAGAAGFAANEEREQTLNQLLVEMDGFDSGTGLVIIAATNRPEILDRALLRAGRFDRQILVDRPDVRGREAILRVHASKVRLGPDVELHVVAQRTPGMVGADLANVVNEAALASVRRTSQVVEARDFEEAIDRIQLGLKKEGRVMTEEEKQRVAFHEAGHALVALSVTHRDPVHRVTIIPRSIGALGVTLQLPTAERYLMTRDELRDRICVMLGGRAAEELVCGDISTGAEDDLERATELALQMVCRFGMSHGLGVRTFGRQNSRFLGMPFELPPEKNYSDETAQAIDHEIERLLAEEYERARTLLRRRREALDAIGASLLAKETLQRDELESIAAEHPAVDEPEKGRTNESPSPAPSPPGG